MDPVMAPPPFDELEDRILPWSQVKVICGLSRTTVWRLQKSGDFPACVQVSLNRVGWWQSELLAWKRARTPRRLPEVRQIPDPPAPAVKALEPASMRRATETAKDPEVVATTGGRKRKATAPDNQTAFDFGG